MARKILITGAGSGFGLGASLGIARNGHEAIAAAQTWQQVTTLRARADELGLDSLRVEKLDLLDPYDVKHASDWDVDVLVNNAGMGEAGPIAEIPVDLVRRNFEVNVFAPLAFTQQVVRAWVLAKKPGKVVFVSSMGGLFSPPGFAAYAATKHALEAIAEAMQGEMKPFGIQVQTINPGAYLTGFNEAMAENAFRWLDDEVNFTKRAAMSEAVANLIGSADGRRDPEEMIAKMIEIIPARKGRFRNVVPQAVEAKVKEHQADMFELQI
jgi:NAD(P)-dependent dehydrogenase (short-subunit alcohol dehydrogenase family)